MYNENELRKEQNSFTNEILIDVRETDLLRINKNKYSISNQFTENRRNEKNSN